MAGSKLPGVVYPPFCSGYKLVMRNVLPRQEKMIVIRTEDTCFGRPRIDGSRLEVYNVVTDLSYCSTIEEYEKERNISTSDLHEIVDYCRELKCQKITRPFEKYCGNCTLSFLHEGRGPDINSFDEIGPGIFRSKENPNHIELGDKDDLADEFSGRPGWIIAEEVWKNLFIE